MNVPIEHPEAPPRYPGGPAILDHASVLGTALFLLLLLLAGCGGSGGSTPAPPPPPASDWGHLQWNLGSWR